MTARSTLTSSTEQNGIVVLISGSGTNLQAIIDQVQSGTVKSSIRAVISNRPGVKGLERARLAGIPAIVLDHTVFPDRDSYDQELLKLVDAFNPQVVVLAGFMRILTTEFVEHFANRLLNIHPALLPKYKGLHTHSRALEAGDQEHGCTVHLVTPELDDGPNIIQAVIPVLTDDDEDSLSARVQKQEHIIYPMAVQWMVEGRLSFDDGHPCLDGEPLSSTGYQIHAEAVTQT